MEAELLEAFPERTRGAVDVWVREEGGAVGSKYRLIKRSLVLLYGAGDIERARVCALAPVPAPCNRCVTFYVLTGCRFFLNLMCFSLGLFLFFCSRSRGKE